MAERRQRRRRDPLARKLAAILLVYRNFGTYNKSYGSLGAAIG
jgi:hypothetical protein